MEAIVEALEQLLPKGIVFDSPTIYAEVAKLPVVPLEDIHRHWKTYTRTHKSLHDPTACRLENFWWHVWGSDRRDLSGKTLAGIWEHIASGPTSVPLRGPPNRWEPPPKPTRSMHESDTTQPTQIHGVASQAEETQSSIVRGAIYGLTPSSSRPPPAHTILKKPRGPSNSGPRPTARFVDVPDSEDETSQQSGENSFGTFNKKPDARPPSSSVSPAKVDRKPAPKKFVASSTTSKRRPVLPRRQSSQSSTGSVNASDSSSRDTASASRNAPNQQMSTVGSKDSSPTKRQNGLGLPTHTEEPAPRARAQGKRPHVANLGRESASASSQEACIQDRSRKASPANTLSPVNKGYSCQENLPQTPQGSSGERPSAKMLGKRPELASAASRGKVPTQKSAHLGSYDGSTGMQMSQPRSVPQSTNSINSADTIESNRRRSVPGDSPRENIEQAGAVGSKTAPKMARSRSNNESKRISSGSLKSSSVVGLSNIAVAGGFDFDTPQARPSDDDLPPLGAGQPDIRAVSVLDSRLTPTQPSPNPPPPLGRSKSQLTLVLERERARAGSTSSRKNDGSKDDGSQKSRR